MVEGNMPLPGRSGKVRFARRYTSPPGNAGTATVAENVPIDVNDFEGLSKFCLENSIDLVVVGPEGLLLMVSAITSKAILP
jgi:phosphoribosylamine-glycine ligase